jgi:hypothetical protein
MEEFRFENSVKLTESQYVAIWRVLPSRPWFRQIRFLALVTAGVIFLFSPYTLLLGLVLLGWAGTAAFLPRALVPGATRRLFRAHRYLRDTLTYGVSEQKLWVKGSKIDACVEWSMLVTWREVEGWLLLSASGIPPVYLSLSRLREEGLYGRVKELAKQNAPEFNKSTPWSRSKP